MDINGFDPLLDRSLVLQLLGLFEENEKKLLQRDWVASSLAAGKFCEALMQLISQLDGKSLSGSRTFDEMCTLLEDNSKPHKIAQRAPFLLIARSLRVVYQIRSRKGVAHFSSKINVDNFDAKYCKDTIVWCLFEFVSLCYTGASRESIASQLYNNLLYETPVISKIAGNQIVLVPGIVAEEEILLHLHYAGDEGITRTLLGKYVQQSPAHISNSLTKLSSKAKRQIVNDKIGKRFIITSLGTNRVLAQILPKYVKSLIS
jgi:hypothetical protein